MDERFLLLTYVHVADEDLLTEWWDSAGRAAVGLVARVDTVHLARVVAGYPSHAVIADVAGLSGFGIVDVLEALATAPKNSSWPGLSPAGAAILGRQIYPPASDVAPVVSTYAPGDHAYIAFANVDPAVEAGFNDWYNNRHLDAVAGAGLRRGTRFEAFGAGHKYFAIYAIDGPEAMHTEALGKVRGFDEYTGKATDLARLIVQVIA